MRIYFLIVLLSIGSNGKSQVLNIDRENGDDSVFHKNIFTLNFGFSLDKQKNDLLECSSQLENDFFIKKNHWYGFA